MRSTINKHLQKRKRIANLVKKNMWANNVRATTEGQVPGTVLMQGKYKVYCTDDQMEEMPKGYNYLALVRDYGDIFRIRVFNKKGEELRAAFYHLGRLGLKIS